MFTFEIQAFAGVGKNILIFSRLKSYRIKSREYQVYSSQVKLGFIFLVEMHNKIILIASIT